MRRSALVVLVTVLVSMFQLLPALPASAATSAQVESPKENYEVTAPVQVRVRVTRGIDDTVSTVRARLSSTGTAEDSYPTGELKCLEGCDGSSAEQRWGALLNPSKPFGKGPIRNGSWRIQPSVNGGTFTSGVPIYLSVPPSQVTNLAVATERRSVRLTWEPAPEPDTGYRVERRTAEEWQAVGKELPPGTSSYSETVPSDGKYEYRVVSVRPKGTPAGGDYTKASGAAGTTVSAPVEQPQPDAEKGGKSDRGSGTAAASSRGSGQGQGAPGGSDAGPRTAGGPLVGSVPPPPPARRGFSFSLRSLGQAFGLQPQDEAGGDGEGYFGEGEGFSEELDYGGIDPVTGEPIAVPLRDTGLQGMLISQLANRPLLMSLAIGLLFVLLAVYILRWVRRSPAASAGAGSSTIEGETRPTWRRRFLRARGERAKLQRVPSPTATPLSPRAANPRPVSGEDATFATSDAPAAASTTERRTTRQSATAPILGGETEAWRGPRGDARSGTSDLFPQRASPATPRSDPDQSGSHTGTETVKVLRPEPSSRGTRRSVR